MHRNFNIVKVIGMICLSVALLLSPLFSGVSQAGGSFTRYYYGSNFYYKIYVPNTYQAGTAVPLLVMLHGCTQDADDFAAGTKMNTLAEEKKFIVLYPEMNPFANANRCWNWFYDYNQHRDSGEPAIIKGMVDKVKKKYSIISSEVFISGISAGGAMSVNMAASYPDVFSKLGVVAGLEYDAADSAITGVMAMSYGGPDPNESGRNAYTEMGTRKKRMPVIVFHGTADSTVNPLNGSQVISQWAQTNDYIDDGIDNDTVTNGAVQTVQGSTNGRSYVKKIYNDASGKPLLEKWEIKDAAHAWFGGSSSGSYTDTQGPNTSRLLYDFFMRH